LELKYRDDGRTSLVDGLSNLNRVLAKKLDRSVVLADEFEALFSCTQELNNPPSLPALPVQC
jgi:hypothetical protein